jgi:N-acetylmuramoyl-L-alanine amidase
MNFRSLLIVLFIATLFAAPSFCEERTKILKVETRKIGAYAEIAVYTSQNIKPEILILDSPNRIAMAFHNAVIDSPVTIPGPFSLINMIQAAQIDDNTVYVIVEPNEEITYDYASILGHNKFILEVTKARPGAKQVIIPNATPSGEIVATATPEVRTTTRELVSSEEALIETEVATEEVLFEKAQYLAEMKTKGAQKKLSRIKTAKPAKHAVKFAATKEAEIELPIAASAEISSITITAEIISMETPKFAVISTEEIIPVEKPKPETPKKEISKIKETEISTLPLQLRGYTIVIDPGHGGRDPGYIGKSGILEKNLTYRISLWLYRSLTDAGAKVIMTRNDDIEIKNRDISELANSSGADMFIAIHLNSFRSPKIHGCETYYYTPQSRLFATVVEKNLSRTTKMKNRGIKRVTYYVVHHSIMPAILVEAGYLTSPKDEAMILNQNYRKLIATGICKGIIEYVKINPKWQKSHK